MMKHLRQQGATIEEKYPGIYYVRGIVSFDTQVVVTSKLEPGLHSSLRILSKNVQEKDIRLFLAETNNLKQPGEIDNINAVLQASVNANVLVYNQVREELGMCDALRDLFKDELEESFNKGEESGRRSAIANMLRNGKTVAQIADFGGFSIEEVREVENEMLEAAK
jgi:hypothetical protein